MKLNVFSFKAQIDDNELTTPGTKFYNAERFGIPLRIEIGQRELQAKQLTVTRRDTLAKTTISIDDKILHKNLKSKLKQISTELRDKIYKGFQYSLIDYTDLTSINSIKAKNLASNKMYFISWCGSKQCAEEIEEVTSFSLLGFDFNSKDKQKQCIICNSKSKKSILAKRY